MTQKFLDTFFRGQWFYYGHFSIVALGAFTIQSFYGFSDDWRLNMLYIFISAFIPWLGMLAKEIYDHFTTFFHPPDILYNTYGAGFYILCAFIHNLTRCIL